MASYKVDKHWVRGSAVLIHKDLMPESDEKFESAKRNYSGARHSWFPLNLSSPKYVTEFEIATVRDKILDVNIHCCYIPNDQFKKNHKEAAVEIKDGQFWVFLRVVPILGQLGDFIESKFDIAKSSTGEREESIGKYIILLIARNVNTLCSNNQY